jgi:RND family efflux transporter MFP subunit
VEQWVDFRSTQGDLVKLRLALPGWLRRLPIALRIGIPAVVLLLIGWGFWPSSHGDLPNYTVRSSEFVIDLKTPGKLKAENSVLVSAPPARINLQIVDLVPEGTNVKEGDFLIQFDTTELRQQLDDQIAELDIARATFDKSRASMESQMASLRSSLENSRASYRLSELRLEQMKFEAEVRLEEGRLSLKQAEISLKRAEEEITAQIQIDSADVKSLELKIKQAQFDIQKTRMDLDRLHISAPRPGLVVYKETWRGGEMSKIKVGDTPWRGAALIELPDLSVMNVETAISEVDFSKIKTGLPVEVKLDAYPEPVFKGEVIEVAALAKTEEGGSGAKQFDVVIRIDGSNPLLRPGMSTTTRIIVDRIPDKRSIPIESVFDRGEKMVVYATDDGSFVEREVKLGARNDNFVIVEEGLTEGERVSLVDPTAREEEGEPAKRTSVSSKSEGSNGARSNSSPPRPNPGSRRGGERRPR